MTASLQAERGKVTVPGIRKAQGPQGGARPQGPQGGAHPFALLRTLAGDYSVVSGKEGGLPLPGLPGGSQHGARSTQHAVRRLLD